MQEGRQRATLSYIDKRLKEGATESKTQPNFKFEIGHEVQHVDFGPGAPEADATRWPGEILDRRVDPRYGPEYLVRWGETKDEVWAPENFLMSHKDFRQAHADANAGPRPKGLRIRRNSQGDYTAETPDGTVHSGVHATKQDLMKELRRKGWLKKR